MAETEKPAEPTGGSEIAGARFPAQQPPEIPAPVVDPTIPELQDRRRPKP